MIVLSGIQPTGKLHLGNYLGAIKNWVDLQDKADKTLFMIADLHAITMPQDPEELRRNIQLTAATLIACGIKKESNIFQQSKHTVHAELAWILSTLTPMGWLERMTQYKDKAGDQSVHMGLFSYPVLMAADILGYGSTHVPVGDDQTQHLQLTRDIAGAFNRRYKTEFFTIPEALTMPTCARVKSLQDGTKKMSKSNPSEYDRINLTDTREEIAHKIKKAKSDNFTYVSYEPATRPEVANLLEIYSALTGIPIEIAVKTFPRNSDLKNGVTDVLVATIGPISDKIAQLMRQPEVIKEYLDYGNDAALMTYEPIINNIHKIVGF